LEVNTGSEAIYLIGVLVLEAYRINANIRDWLVRLVDRLSDARLVAQYPQ
jgi:hypothetical protein